MNASGGRKRRAQKKWGERLWLQGPSLALRSVAVKPGHTLRRTTWRASNKCFRAWPRWPQNCLRGRRSCSSQGPISAPARRSCARTHGVRDRFELGRTGTAHELGRTRRRLCVCVGRDCKTASRAATWTRFVGQIELSRDRVVGDAVQPEHSLRSEAGHELATHLVIEHHTSSDRICRVHADPRHRGHSVRRDQRARAAGCGSSWAGV
jgi:hypothetical protein